MFNQKDLEQIKKKGIDLNTINTQLENFYKGFPPYKIVSAATKDDGIKVFNQSEIKELSTQYSGIINNKKITKFIPASGAASRMFQDLISFRNADQDKNKQEDKLPNGEKFEEVEYFFNNLGKFAFFDELKDKLNADGFDLNQALKEHKYKLIIDYLLYEKGLNYSRMPKALLSFHKYDTSIRTSLEEHLVEAVQFAKDKSNDTRLHFTFSKEHIQKIYKLLDDKIARYEKEYTTNFIITHSIQEESTDIISVDLDNKPFREKDGSLYFRPGGHGALLENLNNLDSDIVFIKNIDNILPDRLKRDTIVYKKVIGAYLLILQERIFNYLEILSGNDIDTAILNEIKSFITNELMIKVPEDFRKLKSNEVVNYLYNKLNRPIRVCGMVKNEGEPGGGPFWVTNADGSISLQIVEASQIIKDNKNHINAMNSSTHFNPVDLVCAIKDFKNRPFNLLDFRDPQTGIITKKTKDGKELKAQELPGLWNGGMADWITVFVEVPISTFSPVKSVNDLLRKEHLG